MNSIYSVPCLLFSCPGGYNLPFSHRFRLATIPLCLLFSCPGANILPCCHRFCLATIPFYLFSHVPEVITYLSATVLGPTELLMLAFFMSQRRYPTVLPQIPAWNNSLCLFFSCPGGYILPICHRFQPGITPCARFFHVPEPISYLPATDSALPQSPFTCFLMSRRL